VPGSESGQTFKYRLYQFGGGTAVGEFTEVANGSTITTTASTLSVEYEGT
jgi:hypothetical protein